MRNIGHHQGGNVAVIFGLAAVPLLGLIGLAIDSADFYNQQSRLQTVADAAALSVAKELHLYIANVDPLTESGRNRIEALLAEKGFADRPHEIDISVDPVVGSAEVDISLTADTFLPRELVWSEHTIAVTAVAQTFGQVKLCVLGLEDTGSDTITADHGARVVAPDCALHSNSTDPEGLTAYNGSVLISMFTCSSGGYEGSETAFVPAPETDCPSLGDPLELRQPPPAGGCDFQDLVLDAGEHTIAPGRYCGGLKIVGNADVLAEPGVYVINGDELKVGNNAILRGEYVSFYFEDDDATLEFKDRATVELSAPRDGPMAGVLLFENPAAPEGRDFRISSDAVRELLGTIYLPRGVFKARGSGNIADLSAYTIIVANRLDLDGANLVINANYSVSDVPVPPGLGPTSSKVRLER